LNKTTTTLQHSTKIQSPAVVNYFLNYDIFCISINYSSLISRLLAHNFRFRNTAYRDPNPQATGKRMQFCTT